MTLLSHFWVKGWFFLHAIRNKSRKYQKINQKNPETVRPTSHLKIDRLSLTEIKIRESKIDENLCSFMRSFTYLPKVTGWFPIRVCQGCRNHRVRIECAFIIIPHCRYKWNAILVEPFSLLYCTFSGYYTYTCLCTCIYVIPPTSLGREDHSYSPEIFHFFSPERRRPGGEKGNSM